MKVLEMWKRIRFPRKGSLGFKTADEGGTPVFEHRVHVTRLDSEGHIWEFMNVFPKNGQLLP